MPKKGLLLQNSVEMNLVGPLGFAPSPQWRHLPQIPFFVTRKQVAAGDVQKALERKLTLNNSKLYNVT